MRSRGFKNPLKKTRLQCVLNCATDCAADEAPRDREAVGEVIEEDVVGQQPLHHLPAGGLHQSRGEFGEVWDAGLGEPQNIEAIEKRGHGAVRKHRGLAGEQRVPDALFSRRVACPILLNGQVAAHLTRRFVR